MNLIVRLILFVIGHQAKLRVIKEAKRHGVVAYMKALQGTRRGLIAALAAFFILQLMLLSFVGALVTGLLLWEAEIELKMQILFGVFLSLFALPFLGLVVLFNERLWYKVSGAQKMVEDLRARRDSRPHEDHAA